MKTELTFEQNRHLLDLGISKEKASIWNKNIVVFKLEDFLNGKILPKQIDLYDVYELRKFEYPIASLNIMMYKDVNTTVGYVYTDYDLDLCYLKSFDCNELIDSFYKLTCWYYEKYKI